ncbi:MAG: hypothetical protein J6S67_16680 [Methanobrevibacter sp.]|nr:hypothetical protein [Methanobrevibacter sp.]
MSKKSTSLANWKASGCWQRGLAYDFYLQKYFNLFMGAYKFSGITYEQQHYILKKLFFDGKISAFIVEGTKLPEGVAPETTNEYPNGMIAFVPFAPCLFSITDFPIAVNLIQIRGATFIPTRRMIVNKDVVLLYIQRNKKSVNSVVEFFIQKIVDVEMTIKNNLKALKTPFFIATTPENEGKMKSLWEKIDNDDGVLYLSSSEIDAIKVLATGTQFNIDKLYDLKQAYENELLTYLGIDNLGILEKKEHMITDEVNSNNDLINDHSENFLSVLQDWCKRIGEVLGYKMSVEATSSPVSAEKETRESEENDNEDDA